MEIICVIGGAWSNSRNSKPSAKSFPISQDISIQEPVAGSGAEDIITPLIKSLFEIQDQQLFKLKAERYDTLLRTSWIL